MFFRSIVFPLNFAFSLEVGVSFPPSKPSSPSFVQVTRGDSAGSGPNAQTVMSPTPLFILIGG